MKFADHTFLYYLKLPFLIIFLTITYLSPTYSQFITLPENDGPGYSDLIIESIDGGVLLIHGPITQEEAATSIKLIELDKQLDIVREFHLSESDYLNASIISISILDADNYLLTLLASDEFTDPFIYDKRLIFIRLSKQLDEYEELSQVDLSKDITVLNFSYVDVDSDLRRYYYTLYDQANTRIDDMYYVDINLESGIGTEAMKSTVNPRLVYRDIEYTNEQLYFAGSSGLFRRNIEEDSFYIQLPIRWPRQGNFFHGFGDLHFEILNNNLFVAGSYINPFSNFEEFGVGVFSLDSISLYEGESQNAPKELYTFDIPNSSRLWTNTISHADNQDFVWAAGGNFDFTDLWSFPNIDNNNGELYVIKIDKDGQEVLRKSIDGNGYVFGASSIATTDGAFYMTGYTMDLESDEFLRGFVLRINSDGELTSTTEIPTQGNLQVFPNPFSDLINTPQVYGGDYSILDLSGRVIYQSSYREYQIDMPDLSTGNYILIVDTDDGRFATKIMRE